MAGTPSGKVTRDVVAVSAAAAGTLAILAVLRDLRRRRRGPLVQGLCIYPMKSAAEVPVATAVALDQGFGGDRLCQVTDGQGMYVTPRDCVGSRHPGAAELFRVRAELLPGGYLRLSKSGLAPLTVPMSGAQLREEEVKVVGVPRPNDNKEAMLDLGDAAAAWVQGALRGPGYRLHAVGPRYGRVVVTNPGQGDVPALKNAPLNLGDEAPYLLCSAESLAALRRRLFWSGYWRTAYAIDMRRFRPNIVVEGVLPWEEDTWKRIRIGEVEFQVWQRCGRCLMTTIDRDTLQKDGVLQMLRTFRKREGPNGDPKLSESNFGMHLIPVGGFPASIDVGARVEVLERDPERVQEWQRLHGPPWPLALP